MGITNDNEMMWSPQIYYIGTKSLTDTDRCQYTCVSMILQTETFMVFVS